MTANPRPYNAVYEALAGMYSEEAIAEGLRRYQANRGQKTNAGTDAITSYVRTQCQILSANATSLLHIADDHQRMIDAGMQIHTYNLTKEEWKEIDKVNKDLEAKRWARVRREDAHIMAQAAALRARLDAVEEEVRRIVHDASGLMVRINQYRKGEE